MRQLKTLFAFFLLLASINNYAQLGFCPGSKGDPLFSENFGNGTTYGPALPPGITTYPFVSLAPNDGQYTLYYRSNLYSTWHYSLDHTPDADNGPNGKMLIVNANAGTSGDFYKKTVSGLCVNTTFEFSAWVLNVYNPNSLFCGAGEIPINVRFEIWNASETVLLGSGNTGNIIGTATPLWQQFALVFTTASETSVVLKMKNNGLGGCGNDLAIDDISFSACGDLTTVSSPAVVGTNFSTCTSPASIQLNAATATIVPYVYQWQSSADGITWTDITGATNPTYNATNITSLTYFRAKAAQDAANLANPFCSTASNVFTVSVLAGPSAAISTGDRTICSDETIPALSVTTAAGTNVNWYSAATGGTLLLAGNTSFTPTAAGIYYAEPYNVTSNCIGSPRTPVELTIVPLPNASITGTTSICSGNTTVIGFSGTPNAVVTYTINGGTNQTITLNASGSASFTTPVLTANSNYTLVSVTSPFLNTCIRTLTSSAVVTVNSSPTASLSSTSPICSGSAATIAFNGTPNALVTYTVDGGANQTVTLNTSGNASVVRPNVTATMVYTLVNASLSGACAQPLSQSVTITVVPVPTASISANPLSVCSSQTSTITITGTPNAIVTYMVDGGINQTINLNASGSATFATPALTANSVYTLVNVASPILNTCNRTLTGNVAITVNTSPTASISSNAPVCSGNAATVTFNGTPNAIVKYTANTVNQTITLSAAGSASIVLPNVTTNSVYTLTDVTLAGVCTQPLSQSITVSAVPLPTATINASPLPICSGQTSTISISGTPNAIVTYTVDGGANQTIILSASGLASFATPALTANSTYTLVNVVSPVLSTCSRTLSDTVTITVNSLPTASFTSTASVVCNGASATLNFSGTPNATIAYSVSGSANQTITLNGSGNASVVLTNITSTKTYTLINVTSAGANGCAKVLNLPLTITAVPLLTATINATPLTICSDETSVLQFIGTPNAVVRYTANGTSQTVTLSASGVASVTVTPTLATNTYQLANVALPGTSCSRTVSGSVVVTMNTTPDVTYSGDLVYCEDESIAVNLASAVAGTTFSWTVVQNGTIGATSGSGNQIAQTVTLAGNLAGTVTYTVTPFHNGCTGDPVNIVVTVHPLPVPTITDGVICLTVSAPTSSQYYTLNTNLSAADHTFQWFLGGTPIPGAFGNTYDANQIGTYTVIATNAAGCISVPVDAIVSEMSQGESLVIDQSAAFSDDPRVTITVVGGDGPFSYQLDHSPFQSSNVFYNLSAGTHTIKVVDAYCTDLTTTVTIINYPKFFTPNGDGYNETWNIEGVGNAKIGIFDRYGKLLKQISTTGLGWDGTYNGKLLPANDYWFTINYLENGSDKSFKAHFALKR